MRKITYLFVILFVVAISVTGCREKSTSEKIEDGIEEVGEDIEEGTEEIEDEIDDATDDN
jgi:predicted small secreted protein